ncbi:MAG: hypothetical protein AAFZ18_32025, partial [Myxococcota bacterium]
MTSLRRCSSSFTAAALMAAALVPTSALAQTFPYVVSEVSRPFSPLSGGTAVTFSGGTDDGGGLVPLGFTFSYFGNSYTHVNVGVNGIMTFAAACDVATPCSQGSCNTVGVCEETFLATGGFTYPSTFVPNAFVAPFWEDLILNGSATVLSGTVGTAPNRELVVEWRDVPLFNSSTSPSDATFQVRLQEGSNVITISYGSFTSGTDAGSWFGIIGTESPGGQVGLTSRTCSTTSNCRSTDLVSLENTAIEIILPDGAELTGEATGPTGGGTGDPLDFSLTVRNVGVATTTVGFESRVYLSDDATIEATDTLLGTLTFPALATGMVRVRGSPMPPVAGAGMLPSVRSEPMR